MTEGLDLPLFRWSDARSVEQERRRRHAARTLAVMASATTLIITPLCAPPVPQLVWNASASAPVGLYYIEVGEPIDRGTLVLVRLPAKAQALAARRGYLPAGIPALKHIAAVGGDRVCARDSRISVAGRPAAHRLARDHLGRPLPWWRGCRDLFADEVLLLNPARADSFDGRYLGPTLRRDVIGRAVPLWVR